MLSLLTFYIEAFEIFLICMQFQGYRLSDKGVGKVYKSDLKKVMIDEDYKIFVLKYKNRLSNNKECTRRKYE